MIALTWGKKFPLRGREDDEVAEGHTQMFTALAMFYFYASWLVIQGAFVSLLNYTNLLYLLSYDRTLKKFKKPYGKTQL